MTVSSTVTVPDSSRPHLGPADGGEPISGSHPAWRLRTLTIVFVAESVVLALLQIPLNLSFMDFMTLDQGANLTVQALLDRGLVPTVDFGYQYGLLPLLIGRSWFALLGRTPYAYAAAMLIIDVLIAWGLARCASALRVGPAGIALILCTMTASTLGSYINLAHACEAALICHALADHAGGRRSRALALLTACLFVKPVMAYLYGLLLVILIFRASGLRGLVRAAIPAAVVGALLSTAMVVWFGPMATINSLIPVRGAESYRMVNYGFFFGRGRRFWLPEGVTPRLYLFTHAGHYLLGSVILVAATAAAVWRLVRGRPARETAARDDLNSEIIACCGMMHVAFVSKFYGDFMSYTYYYYILIIGLVAMSARGTRQAVIVGLLAVAALVGNKDWGGNIKHQWRDRTAGADTSGLWADAATHEEWRQIRRILGDKTCSLLVSNGGCPEILLPQFAEPEDIFLTPGVPLPNELQRKLRQVATAEFVLTCAEREEGWSILDRQPEFRKAIDGCEPAWSGERFLLYRRLRPPKPFVSGPETEPPQASPPNPAKAATE